MRDGLNAQDQPRKSGLSLGTVLVLALSVITMVGGLIILPILRGSRDLRADTQEFVTVLQDAVSNRDASTAPAKQDGARALLPSAAPLSTPALTQSRTLSFTFAGACSFGPSIQESVSKSAAGYAPLLEGIAPEMTGDVKIATLENHLTGSSQKADDYSAPPDVLDALKAAQINLLLLGHEHALDAGEQGITATLERLNASGIASTGLRVRESDKRVFQFSVSGLMIAVMHYNERPLSSVGQKAMGEARAAVCLNGFDLDVIARDIAQMRADGARLIIVSLHWGESNSNTQTTRQRQQAQVIADAGADIIIGAHSGAVQPVELLSANRSDGKPAQTLVAYSLGSLICDGENDQGVRKSTHIAGMLMHVTLTWNAEQEQITFAPITYTPTYIWRNAAGVKYEYRVIASDRPAPEAMSENQRTTMEKALARIEQVLAGSPVTLRAR